ncbi:alpha/beta fold hydrolase [Tessaracoccus oleiagri]|uniref:Pimeloyl-ACP methyl ester carboxylesterase n=1 Tax=Tessaracoccus oleiagri TaxID=686624 RepID=A0A1G9KJJ8_9ACTN|nr:alpha/beta hydrolase [Tessaracoccus oleiagri]SDL49694.1 Pimeloyl-ACP methyl ester carboxylesterase [Tessaracoccus oleiagri]
MSETIQQSYRLEEVPGGLHFGLWEPEAEPVGTIVAIHGVTSSHRAFATVARALPEYRIVAPDLRGRGRSNALPRPYGMARHADDVAEVLDHLGIERALPVGHSMGAFVAVVLAHRHPRFMDRLVLVDGGMPLELPAGVAPDESIAAILGPAAERLSMTFASPEEYRDLWRAHPAFPQPWSDDVTGYIDYDLDGEAAPFRPATKFAALEEDTIDLAETDGALMAAIEALAVPALFLQAERGMLDQPTGLFRDEYLARWVERVPNLTSRKVEGINHYTIVFDPPGVEAIVRAVKEGT